MTKIVKIGSDFSGVGAFDYAINRIAESKGFGIETMYACDWDKYARISYIAAHGEPKYYPKNVYEREIPSESLDVYMTSPPCQAFSLAGKRLGKEDKRGVLFFNSHEFIEKNKPRFFIFENVKGLLSDDNGRTFSEWINMLGGKSVNGLPVLFPYQDSVPYHLYWHVLNTKNHGVPQNRERVFIIGVRDDADNSFQFPKEEHLIKRLKDVLESDVDEKYFLSENQIKSIINSDFAQEKERIQEGNFSSTLLSRDYKSPKCVKIKSATSRGYETATENDSINFSVPNLETRRVSPATNAGQSVWGGVCIPVLTPDRKERRQNGRRFKTDGEPAFTVTTQDQHGIYDGFKIRRLTPLECFRLQDFPDSHVQRCKDAKVSDSQLYKQAGNSITVRVLEKILNNLLT